MHVIKIPVSGYPQPKYKWVRDGVSLGDFSSELFYRIMNIRREDAGSYQCIAKNDVGSIFSQKSDVSVACKWNFKLTYVMIIFQNNDELLTNWK